MSQKQRQEIISMIDHARTKGARLKQACECVEIDAATYRRWQCDGEVIADQRATALPLGKCWFPTDQSGCIATEGAQIAIRFLDSLLFME